MDDHEILALLAALVLVLVHLFAARLRFLGHDPRSRWLSVAGGVAVAYVFVHLLPELAEGQASIERGHGGEAQAGDGPLLEFLEDHVYVVALIGLTVFYGVEKHSLSSRRSNAERSGDERTGPEAFWLSIASFAVYNALIGYLLLREELRGLQEIAFYTVALGVHFTVNDIALREHHRDAYDHVGRWLISAAVLAGCVAAFGIEISERVIAVVIAFIAGGVVLNVFKEELPGERRAQFWPFALGAFGYAALLQLV